VRKSVHFKNRPLGHRKEISPMKANLLKSAVLMASLAAALTPASAETLHATIPFGFSANGIAMPAGTYAISTIPNATPLLLFENEATKVKAIVFARYASRTPVKPAARLTFSPSASEFVELTNITGMDSAYEIDMRSARGALKSTSLALTSSGK
jgi:hypothetical protein